MTERRGTIQTVNFPRVTGSFRGLPVVGSNPIAEVGVVKTVGTVITGTPFTVNLTTSPTDGNLLVMMMYKQGVSAGQFQTPVGWTSNIQLKLSKTNDDRSYIVFYKVASSEGATVDVSAIEASSKLCGAIVIEYSNVHADVFDKAPVAADVTFGATNDRAFQPSIVTVSDNAVVIHFAAVFATVTLESWVPRANYTLRESHIALGNAFGVATRQQETAGATGAGLWSNTSGGGTQGDYLSMTFALKPL